VKGSSQKRRLIVRLQAHTEKSTYRRDLQYVTKANITPEEEFKTAIHSIKREAERKFKGALTKFHYRCVERNNDELRGAKSDKYGSKKTLIELSITPRAQSNSSTHVLHSSAT